MAGYTGIEEIRLLTNDQFKMIMPRNQGIFGQFNILALNDVQFQGPRTAVGSGHPPTPGRVGYQGLSPLVESPGLDWFDRVHLIPRTEIVFGNIVSSVQATYELFSAWRSQTVLVSIVNNIEGVTLPDQPALPSTLPSFTSFLDAASTRLSKIKTTVNASIEGAAVFDDFIEFLFSTGDEVALHVSGNRISLMTPPWESDFLERFAFLTDIIPTISGKEQRLSLRRNPRQELQVNYLLGDEERQRMLSTLFGWQTQLFAVPMWHLELKSTASVSASATVVQTNTTTNFDLRVGGLAVIWESATKFDVVLVSAVAANSVTFTTTPVLNSYSSGVKVLPVRLAYIANVVRGARHKTKLENFQITFVIVDNDTGAMAESTSGWSTYNGKVLLDGLNVMDNAEMPEEFRQQITYIDNETGQFSTSTRWARHKRSSMKGFVCHSRAEILTLRKLLLAFRGKQKSWWLPTFAEDMTIAANLSIGTSTIDISHIGYARFVGGALSPRDTIRVTFTDGTSLTRTIASAIEVSSTVERLTLNTTWPANRTMAEIRRIEYLELVRFDTDVFTFRYPEPSTALVSAPVVTVFD